MNKIWFISDTHWGHSKIIEYCNRPFYNVNDMNEKLILNWNSIVSKDDIVYHLGDFAFGNKDFISNIVSQLNGRIRLICGNHDFHNNQWYRDCGIEEAYHVPIIIKDFLILSHEPQTFTANYNGPFINLFGHVHDSTMFETYGHRHVCVCVERHNYKPIELGDIYNHFK